MTRFLLTLAALLLTSAAQAAPLTFTIITIGPTDEEHTAGTGNSRYSAPLYLNEAGQVAGVAQRVGSTVDGQTAWLYDGSSTRNIGLTDTEHTQDFNNKRSSYPWGLNGAGQVAGLALRYNGGADGGQSAWFFDGSSTENIGLTDVEHTRSTDNYRFSDGRYLNEAGQVAGFSNRYSGSTSTGQTAWLYDGTSTRNIGLTDTEHTESAYFNYRFNDPRYLNDAGQVAGVAQRSGAAGGGQTAWLYDGGSTRNIGLTDAEHTRSTTNYRFSDVRSFNEAGQVAGYAWRGDTTIRGYSAWLYDGSSTQNIGLTDAEHTRSTDGYRLSDAEHLNEAGQVVGYADRYSGGISIGQTAWLFDGSSTENIGLTDVEHTRSTDNYRFSDGRYLNEAGQVAGFARRYSGATAIGASAWLFDGSSTENIGLTDFEHTRSTDNYRSSTPIDLNEAGQVAGHANRYNGGTWIGRSAWFFDGTTTVALDPLSISPSDGWSWMSVNFLGEDGLVLGAYTLFDESGVDLGDRAFWYMQDEGVFDLGLLVDASFTEQDWVYLANALSANLQGVITGHGLLGDMTSGQVAYLLAPIPIPAAIWLLGSAFGLLGWTRRKSARPA